MMLWLTFSPKLAGRVGGSAGAATDAAWRRASARSRSCWQNWLPPAGVNVGVVSSEWSQARDSTDWAPGKTSAGDGSRLLSSPRIPADSVLKKRASVLVPLRSRLVGGGLAVDRDLNLAIRGGSGVGVTVLGGVSKAVSSEGKPLKLEAGEDGKDISESIVTLTFLSL